MKQDKKIRYKDLSVWLKVAAIGGILSFGIYTISFIYGFMMGFLGV